MNNKVSIKKLYLYNKELHNQIIKKEKKKRLICTIVSLLIIVISVFGVVNIIVKDNWINYLVIVYFILMIMAGIFFFCFLHNLILLGNLFTEKALFLDRGYAITNKDEIITFKFNRSSPYFRYNILKNNLLDEVIKILSLQISIHKDKKKIKDKTKEKDIALNDLIECTNIINVYKIKENEDCIEILCDYVDLIKNTCRKKQPLTIYKYYEDWEEFLDKIKIQKDKIKKSLTKEDGEHSGFVDFVLKSSLRKSNAIFFHTFFAYALLCSIKEEYLFALWLEIGIASLIGILYFQKRALKYLYKNDADAKEFLFNKIKNNKIVIAVYLILLIVYSIINIKEIPIILISAIFIYSILFVIIRKIEK